jgi:addiction module HigA family antidote
VEGEFSMPMKNPPHPGRIVGQDCLAALDLSVTEGAKRLGVSRTPLSRLINCKAGISADMAIRLEKMGWSTAGQWLRLQTAYDLAQARQHEDDIRVERLEAQPA